MEIDVYPPMQGRPCRFCLMLQDGCVFADFEVDSDGRVFAVRVSFDGHGCCSPTDVGRMSPQDSAALLAMVAQGAVAAAEPILRAYFQQNRHAIWSDALEENELL